jgi:hypothetical protein
MGVWGRKSKDNNNDNRSKRRKRRNAEEIPPTLNRVGGVENDAPNEPPSDEASIAPSGDEDSKPRATIPSGWKRPRFVGKIEGDLDDPVEIVNVLLNGLRAQGITADKLTFIAGFGRNTLSKWKRNVTTPPEWIGFLFKVLIMEMQSGTNMVEFLKEIEQYKI